MVVRRWQRPHRVRRDRSVWLLAAPGVVFFAIFSYAPMAGAVVAFKDYNVYKGILGSPWSGLDNFQFFFRSGDAWRIMVNTLALNSLFIVATTVCSVGLAILLNEIRSRVTKRVLQSTVFLPYFISPVVMSLMLQGFLQGIGGTGGLANDMFGFFGFPPVDWYAEPGVWPALLTLLKVWQMTGYLSIIYLAAITSIPEEVYEAGRIDGASRARMAWHITLPMLFPTMAVLLIINVGRIFYGDFGTIYAIVGDNGALFPTTDVIDTYVFRALRTLGDFGMTAAIGLMQAVVGLVLVSATLLIARRWTRGSGLL